MTSSNSKSLPRTPNESPIHVHGLSVESDSLITTLLSQAIAEEGLETLWLEPIKAALCDFGRYIDTKETLFPGIRSSRQRLLTRSRRSSLAPDPKPSQQQDNAIKEKATHGSVAQVMELDSIEPRKSVFSAESKLKQIRHRILTQTSSESLSSIHLLVAVSVTDHNALGSPYESPVILFEEDVFRFPHKYSDAEGTDSDAVIYGLENWQSEPPLAYITGGTFTLKSTPSEHDLKSILCTLRLSLYVYLSLILEQSLLHDCHVTLQYPPPKPVTTSSPLSVPAELAAIPEETPRAVRTHNSTISRSGASIWSFISRKTGSIIHRVSGSSQNRHPDGHFEEAGPNKDVQPSSHLSGHGTITHHGVDLHDSTSPLISDTFEREQTGTFTATVHRLRESTCILSTSLEVRFPPPSLFRQLVSREEEQRSSQAISSVGSSTSSSISSTTLTMNSSLKLTGIERAGLASIIGWEGRESRGKGMYGIKGFIRQQNLTLLYRKHVPTESFSRLCGKPSYITYRYYSQNTENTAYDFTLGQLVENVCDKEVLAKQCPVEHCEGLMKDHVHSWTCDDVMIEGRLHQNEDQDTEIANNIVAWQSCHVCQQETSHQMLDAKTYLFSFAKFIEVLIWSPMFRSLSLCQHVNPSSWKDADEADARTIPYNIVYHFSHDGCTLSLKPIRSSIFELRFPRLQFMSGSNSKEAKSAAQVYEKKEKDELETHIEQWWQGIRMRIDRLNDTLEKLMETNKDLPPLPSSDDEGDGDDNDEEKELAKERFSPSLSPNIAPPQPRSFSQISANDVPSFSSSYIIWNNIKNFVQTAPYPPSLPFRATDSRVLLSELEASFQKTKELLKAQVIGTSPSSLNDVRRNFKTSAQGILNRLYAWQKKHVPGTSKDLLNGDNVIRDPEWWNSDCHAVSGGRVLVREGESGSIIAFTLSSMDYQRELAAYNLPSGYSTTKQFDFDTQRSGTLVSSSSKKHPNSSATSPDPDLDDDIALWSQTESCVATVTKCKHLREESLLGLRDALLNANSSESSNSSSNARLGGSIPGGTVTPSSAWAQPQVQVSLDAADGELTQVSPRPKSMEEKLVSSPSSYIFSPTPTSLQESQGYNESNTRGRTVLRSEAVPLAVPIPVPYTPSSAETESNSLTDTLTSAVRHLFTSGPKPPSRAPSPAPPPTLHALLAYGSLYSMDEQPHIRYECTIGDRLKFSCTVYYAKQFDVIRRRCGVDADIINSLQRSETWMAAGGKSRSNFWRSLDGKFVIKTLVNAWNVADLQVLIDLAPSYFRYIESTTTKPSTLAKLMGFYTVEVKNLVTGTIQAKHDVLVMENLFYGCEISRIYDLKGIASRKVKSKGEPTRKRTLHDSEWIEVQKQAPILLCGHSAHILREGLRADAEFLAKSNIMDYSLLLGVDEKKCQIACGLVDTIGSYTFAKTLEYKAKHNLSTVKGKEVTVIPPTEYQHRFTTALESYFLICPDRWTKPQSYVDRTTPYELPEVL